MILLPLSTLSAFGLYTALGKTMFISLGTIVFVLGQLRGQHSRSPERAGAARSSHVN